MALIAATRSSSGRGGRPWRFGGRPDACSAMLERATWSVEHTVFIVNRPLGHDSERNSCFFGPVATSSASLRISASSVFLALQALQLADLVLQGPVLRGGNDLFLGTGGRQGFLGGELAPAKQLVGRHAMPAGDQTDRRIWLVGLLNDGQLLATAQWRRRCGPSRTSIFGQEPVIAATLLLSLRGVGDRVRSVQGLLHRADEGTAGSWFIRQADKRRHEQKRSRAVRSRGRQNTCSYFLERC
jgi:hypothetical protein